MRSRPTSSASYFFCCCQSQTKKLLRQVLSQIRRDGKKWFVQWPIMAMAMAIKLPFCLFGGGGGGGGGGDGGGGGGGAAAAAAAVVGCWLSIPARRRRRPPVLATCCVLSIFFSFDVHFFKLVVGLRRWRCAVPTSHTHAEHKQAHSKPPWRSGALGAARDV